MASTHITDDTPVQNNTTSNSVENQTSLPLSSKSLNFAITVKLDDENHLLWKSQIMTIIRSHDLEGHITGEITSPCQTLPNQTTKNPAYITWRRHDQTVLNWIFSSLTEGIHAQVIGCETAFAAWDYLEKIFTGQSRARIGQLRLQLQTTKKSGMSMNDYLVKMKRYIDKLAAVGYKVSLEEEVQYILSGLGPEYEAFVTSINNRQGDINMSELRSLALIQESRIESMNIGSESIQQGFANLAVQGRQLLRGNLDASSGLYHLSLSNLRHSCPHTHEQQGCVERKHRHIVELGLTLLAQASMPLRFWEEAFNTAVHLINRLPTPIIKYFTPLEKLYKQRPNYDFLKVFGCECFPHMRPYNRHKLDFRSKPCTFIGYSNRHKGYKCLDSSGHVYVSRDVIFNEHSFPFSIKNSNPVLKSFPSCNMPIIFESVIPSYAQLSEVQSSRAINDPPSQPSHLHLPVDNPNSTSPLANTLDHIHQPANSQLPDLPAIQLPAPLPPPTTLHGHPMQTRSKSDREMLLHEMFIIDGYVKNGCVVDGLRCFMEMRLVSVRVDAMTIVSVLVAAGMVGNVSDDAQVRKIMKRKGVDKTPVSEFISSVTLHSKLTKHIYEMLNYINVELKLIGYVSDKDFLAFDMDVA
ncbi:hypothetical protein EZV62_009692 [Acer yangbiense]|uniref:Retroviral polymerase SH3-like domain-containing protein n=1 Tax=Acer yangbiense TaxID=1000413 RepID=A0A5C7I193_9ROSI|nr:hypothetical protein EZV62_009692 [Acer yangbiense]